MKAPEYKTTQCRKRNGYARYTIEQVEACYQEIKNRKKAWIKVWKKESIREIAIRHGVNEVSARHYKLAREKGEVCEERIKK